MQGKSFSFPDYLAFSGNGGAAGVGNVPGDFREASGRGLRLERRGLGDRPPSGCPSPIADQAVAFRSILGNNGVGLPPASSAVTARSVPCGRSKAEA